jgi:hypothetical protein
VGGPHLTNNSDEGQVLLPYVVVVVNEISVNTVLQHDVAVALDKSRLVTALCSCNKFAVNLNAVCELSFLETFIAF